MQGSWQNAREGSWYGLGKSRKVFVRFGEGLAKTFPRCFEDLVKTLGKVRIRFEEDLVRAFQGAYKVFKVLGRMEGKVQGRSCKTLPRGLEGPEGLGRNLVRSS